MIAEGKSVAAEFAVSCLEKAEHATRGSAPDADRELAKATVYAILALVEALEGAEGPVFTRE